MAQSKLYKAGQKRPAGAGTVMKGTQQGATSKTQSGHQHEGKNRAVNHGRKK